MKDLTYVLITAIVAVAVSVMVGLVVLDRFAWHYIMDQPNPDATAFWTQVEEACARAGKEPVLREESLENGRYTYIFVDCE